MRKHVLAAVLAAILTVNLLCAGLYALPAKSSVAGKPTPDVWEANRPVILGTEGYGVNRTDRYGYNNPDGILEHADGYALALGSSHTQAFNVNRKDNYCSVYNRYAKEHGKPLLYNVGMDANNFADIVKHFPAAVGMFPDAAYILMETPYFTFTAEELSDALRMEEYRPDPEKTGVFGKLYDFAQSQPLLRLLVRQWMDSRAAGSNRPFLAGSARDDAPDRDMISWTEYERLLDACFAALRQTTDKPLLLMYHRPVTVTASGGEIAAESIDGKPVLPLVEQLCAKYDMALIVPDEAYLDNYRTNHTLPYGFANSVYGQGHLNKTGHALLADCIAAQNREDRP